MVFPFPSQRIGSALSEPTPHFGSTSGCSKVETNGWLNPLCLITDKDLSLLSLVVTCETQYIPICWLLPHVIWGKILIPVAQQVYKSSRQDPLGEAAAKPLWQTRRTNPRWGNSEAAEVYGRGSAVPWCPMTKPVFDVRRPICWLVLNHGCGRRG